MAVLLTPVNQTNAKVSENCQLSGVVVVVVVAFLMVVCRGLWARGDGVGWWEGGRWWWRWGTIARGQPPIRWYKVN